MKAGDKCPQCKEGLLLRTGLGIACDECSFEKEIAEIVVEAEKARTQAGEYKFKAKKFSITIDDPEAGEEFLRGLILAKQNNNSVYFQELVDAVNSILEPWRAAEQRETLRNRDAGM